MAGNRPLRPTDDLRVYQDSPSDRATVALVFEAVKSSQAITERGFIDVQRQLDALRGIPEAIGDLRVRVTQLDGRVHRVEADAFDAATAVRKAAEDRAAEVRKAAEDREGEVREAADARAEEVADAAKLERAYKRIHLPAIALGFLGFLLAVSNRIWGVG